LSRVLSRDPKTATEGAEVRSATQSTQTGVINYYKNHVYVENK